MPHRLKYDVERLFKLSGSDIDVSNRELFSSANIVLELGDNAGVNKLSIQDSDDVEIFAVDSNGNVTISGTAGVGLADPDGTLHVHTASAGVVTAVLATDDLVVENSSDGGISILTPDGSNSNIYFGSPSDNLGAAIVWNYDNGLLDIGSHLAGAELSLSTAAGTEAMRIDTNQNVGIGTSSPDGTLHVHTGSAGAVTAHTSYDDIVIEGAGNSGMTILVPDASIGQILFGNEASNTNAALAWNLTNNIMNLGTVNTGANTVLRSGDNVEAIRIDGDQNVDISAGDLDVSAGNITLSGTVDGIDVAGLVASGSWTPDLLFGGSKVDMTFSTQTGQWERVGKIIVATVNLVLTAKGSSTGTATIDFPAIAGYTVIANGIAGSMGFHSSMANLTSEPFSRTTSATEVTFYDTSATAATVLDEGNFTDTTALRMTLYGRVT